MTNKREKESQSEWQSQSESVRSVCFSPTILSPLSRTYNTVESEKILLCQSEKVFRLSISLFGFRNGWFINLAIDPTCMTHALISTSILFNLMAYYESPNCTDISIYRVCVPIHKYNFYVHMDRWVVLIKH